MRVLITGATGLIGSRIVALCRKWNIGVNYLTTSKDKIEDKPEYRGFYWKPKKNKIDAAALEGVIAIINLAGENIAKRWTEKNKQKILNSRINIANLLFETLKTHEHQVGQIVSASGVSIYPSSLNKLYYEDEKAVNNSFLGKVVVQWEAAANQFKSLGLRVAKIRTGVVLAKKGGALPKMEQSFKFNAGAVLGSGKQWQSWIHIEDMARIYLFAIQNGLEGTYNAVAPNPVTNKELMYDIAHKLNKKIWLPNVPAFALKLVLGEMASTVLESQLVDSKKIQDAGFNFHFTNINRALLDLNQ